MEAVQVKSRPVWNGLFTNWQEATQASSAGVNGGAFDGARWADRILGQLRDYRTAIASDRSATPPRPCALPEICAASASRRIVDFGGSSGWAYDYLVASLGPARIESYTIVEIEPVVAMMTKSALHTPTVQYRSSAAALPACDVLYSNSALQYAQSNEEFLSIAERTSPNLILLDDLVALGGEDYFTLQNYFETTIPYRFIGLEALLEDFKRSGYREVMRKAYPTVGLAGDRPYEMDNFPEEKRLRHPLSLLLSRDA